LESSINPLFDQYESLFAGISEVSRQPDPTPISDDAGPSFAQPLGSAVPNAIFSSPSSEIRNDHLLLHQLDNRLALIRQKLVAGWAKLRGTHATQTEDGLTFAVVSTYITDVESTLQKEWVPKVMKLEAGPTSQEGVDILQHELDMHLLPIENVLTVAFGQAKPVRAIKALRRFDATKLQDIRDCK
jgi:hypothetical protein